MPGRDTTTRTLTGTFLTSENHPNSKALKIVPVWCHDTANLQVPCPGGVYLS